MKEWSNEQWLEALRGPQREKALGELRAILVRGLRATLQGRAEGDVEDFAQEGLIRVLDNLDSFRGEARFTTWAQKIAIRVAFTEMRRRRWQDVSLQEMAAPYEDSGREIFSDPSPDPEEQAGKTEMLGAVWRIIEEELTDKQRQAMLAVMGGGMPLEEVARRQGTSRGALYKLLHDARRKIRKRMMQEGFSPRDVLDTLDRG